MNYMCYMLLPPSIINKVTQPAWLLHSSGLVYAIYCLALDLLVQQHEAGVIRQQERSIRRSMVQQVEQKMPANIVIDFHQFGPMNTAKILDMYDRLSQEADNMRDYLNIVGILVNQRAVFPDRVRQHRGIYRDNNRP